MDLGKLISCVLLEKNRKKRKKGDPGLFVNKGPITE